MMESPFEVRAIAAKRLVQKNKLRGSVAQIAIREMFRLPNQDGTGGIEQACSSCDERVKKQSGPVVDYIRRRGLKGSGPTTRPLSGSGPSRPQRSRKLAILKSVAVKRKKRRAARQVLAPSAVEGEADYERDSPVKEEDSEEDSEEDRDLRGKRSEKRRIKVRVSELGRTARRESSFRMVLRSVEREMPLVLKENRDRPVSPEKGPLQEVDMPVVVVHPKKHPWGSWVCDYCRQVNSPEEDACTVCGDDFHNSNEWADDLNLEVKRKAKAKEKERVASLLERALREARWYCSRCDAANLVSRVKCFRCSQPKPKRERQDDDSSDASERERRIAATLDKLPIQRKRKRGGRKHKKKVCRCGKDHRPRGHKVPRTTSGLKFGRLPEVGRPQGYPELLLEKEAEEQAPAHLEWKRFLNGAGRKGLGGRQFRTSGVEGRGGGRKPFGIGFKSCHQGSRRSRRRNGFYRAYYGPGCKHPSVDGWRHPPLVGLENHLEPIGSNDSWQYCQDALPTS